MGAPVLWTSTRTTGTIARLLLAEAGLAHETRFLSLKDGEHRRPEYLAVNPKAQVPALVLEDGTVITENIAIAAYAGAMAPGSGVMPADPVGMAQALGWLSWGVCSIVSMWQPAFLPGRFTGGGEAAEAAVAAAAQARAVAAMDHAEAALADRESLLGGPPTAPDLMLAFMTTMAGAIGLGEGRWPNLEAHRGRVAARPKVAAVLAEEGLG
jgi:glutathione S-transferase